MEVALRVIRYRHRLQFAERYPSQVLFPDERERSGCQRALRPRWNAPSAAA